MSQRDRLAALLHDEVCVYHDPEPLVCGVDHGREADALLAHGVYVKEPGECVVTEETLARAMCDSPGVCFDWGVHQLQARTVMARLAALDGDFGHYRVNGPFTPEEFDAHLAAIDGDEA